MGHLDSQRSLPTIRPDPGGFSPLVKKLRLTAEHTAAVLNAPDGYMALLSPGPAGIKTELALGETYDAVVLFVKDAEELRRLGPSAIRAIKSDGMLWISYPKGGTTTKATDLPATPWWMQRDVLGEITSVKGYKPVAFVSVDQAWTALRFKRV